MKLVFILLINKIISKDYEEDKEYWKIDKNALSGNNIKYEPHHGHDLKSYVQLTLNYTLIKPIFNKLKDYVKYEDNIDLISRNEAHITVINPYNYYFILKDYINIKTIDEIALKYKIQDQKIKAICIGKGESFDNKEKLISYFIVLDKNHLFSLNKIRYKVFKTFVKNGGIPSHYDYNTFYPHITLGFNKRDLFIQDGVYKSINSCWKRLVYE